MTGTASAPPAPDPQRAPVPGKYVKDLGAFSLEGSPEKIPVRPLENAPMAVQNFSDISRPETIRTICHEHVPGWRSLQKVDLAIDQICEGLSNQLFKVYIDRTENTENTSVVECVLFRIYGREVSQLYDASFELETFMTLSRYQIAPKTYGNGEGWRIEEFHCAVTLKVHYMRNPSVLTQVASQLGRFHKLSYRHDFPRTLLNHPPASVMRLQHWGDNCEKAAAKLAAGKCSEVRRRLHALNIPEVLAERDWLGDYVLEDDVHVKGSGLDVIFSHCDVQVNNILQTHYGLRFIDFEYSSVDHQAYDIANFFCECMYDYTTGKYPFFTETLSNYPDEREMRLFASIYLSEYLESSVRPDDPTVTTLLGRVRRFTLMSHYLWCIWSVVRAPQASTFNEFDFLVYAQARWNTYRRDKRALLSSRPRSMSSRSISHQEKKVQKTPYFVGGALTASGMLLGAVVVAAVLRLTRR